jgi:hypothetical protein
VECQRIDTWARKGWIGEADVDPLGRCQGGKGERLRVNCPCSVRESLPTSPNPDQGGVQERDVP